MRLSELNGKEVIDVTNGARLGIIYNPEATLDLEQGVVSSIIMKTRRWLWREEANIPWESLMKISPDLILVDLEQKSKKTDAQNICKTLDRRG